MEQREEKIKKTSRNLKTHRSPNHAKLHVWTKVIFKKLDNLHFCPAFLRFSCWHLSTVPHFFDGRKRDRNDAEFARSCEGLGRAQHLPRARGWFLSKATSLTSLHADCIGPMVLDAGHDITCFWSMLPWPKRINYRTNIWVWNKVGSM